MEEYIRNNKMVTNCIDTDLDLFAEIKKQRMDKNQDEVTIDGVVGKGISEKFAEIYTKLYNTVEDDDEVKKVDRSRFQLQMQTVLRWTKLQLFLSRRLSRKLGQTSQTLSLSFLQIFLRMPQ